MIELRESEPMLEVRDEELFLNVLIQPLAGDR